MNQPTTEYNNVEGYGYFNYAVLHGTGIAHIFNFMRYNRCFVSRRTDFDRLIDCAKNYAGKSSTSRYAVLMCKYDWRGKTKPNWAEDMLTSDQELEHVQDDALFELSSDRTEVRPPKKLQLQQTVTIEGPVAWVVEVMYVNRAVPHEELDARKMESAFYSPQNVIKVRLSNYVTAKQLWTIPDIPK